MPAKVELLRCSGCGYTLTRDKFNEICFADSCGKDHYIGLIEDGNCPECCKDLLEDISLEDFIAAWNNHPSRNETIEECTHIVETEGLPEFYEVEMSIWRETHQDDLTEAEEIAFFHADRIAKKLRALKEE